MLTALADTNISTTVVATRATLAILLSAARITVGQPFAMMALT
jgi:hypothetical protein